MFPICFHSKHHSYRVRSVPGVAPIASKWSPQIGGNFCCGTGRCCSDGLLTAEVPDRCQAGWGQLGPGDAIDLEP